MKKLLEGFKFDYYVTDTGIVFKKDLELSQHDNGNGYFYVMLRTKDNKRVHKYVHRLVWEVFKGHINGEINHIDHDKSNNNLNNLEDVTRSENIRKAVQFHGKEAFIKNRKPKKIYNCPICGEKMSRNNKVCKRCANKIYGHRSEEITKDKLIEKMLISNSFIELGRYFNITDNAVRRWCRKYNLPTKKATFSKWKKKKQH